MRDPDPLPAGRAESSEEVCGAPCEAPQTALLVEASLPKDLLEELSSLFRLLGDPLRLQMIHLLARHEVCVCDLSATLRATQSNVSNHLRVLRAHKLVRTRKEGRLIYYSLSESGLAALLEAGLRQLQPAQPTSHGKPPR